MALDLAICILGWVTIAAHTWSLRYHFNMPKMPPGVRLISTLVILSAAWLTFLTFRQVQPNTPQFVGLALMIASFLLFWWTIAESRSARLLAAFDEKLPHCVLRTGPYAWVRHPFYVSYLLKWGGWALAAWDIWALVPVIAMGTTYYVAAGEEEASFTDSENAEAYEIYRKQTGRFFPRLFAR